MKPTMRSVIPAQAEVADAPRILIVDDDQDIRETLRMAMEEDGYEVFEAEDGAEALMLIHEYPAPLVVVLDYRMPRLNGISVLRRTHDDEPAPRLFVMVTANRAMLTSAQVRLLQRLDVPVVEKPFDLNDLLDLVMQAAISLSDQQAG